METIKTKMKKSEKGFFAFADFYGGGGQAFISVVYFFFLTNALLKQQQKFIYLFGCTRS